MYIKTLASLVLALVLSQCTHWQPMVDTKYSESLEKALPPHRGTPQHGTYQIYNYTVYDNSVSLKGPAVAQVSVVHAYDMNRDGKLDSVFAKVHGTWRFGSILDTPYPLIRSTLAHDKVVTYLNLTNSIRHDLRQREDAQRKRHQLREQLRKEIQKEESSPRWNKVYRP